MGRNLFTYCRNGKSCKLRTVIIGTTGELHLDASVRNLIPGSVRLKSTINTRKGKQLIHRAEIQLLQDRVKGINDILLDNTVKSNS